MTAGSCDIGASSQALLVVVSVTAVAAAVVLWSRVARPMHHRNDRRSLVRHACMDVCCELFVGVAGWRLVLYVQQ